MRKKKVRFFTERQSAHLFYTVGVKDLIYSRQTPWQKLDIYDTHTFGRMLTLDNVVMTSERDEFCYHEMLVHPPLFAHGRPRTVLIVGGGDGGSLREVLRHSSVKRAVLVEIDEEVVKAAAKYLPRVHGGSFFDKRAKILYEDGADFLKKTEEKFDVILVDSTDPVGPGKILFSSSFYKSAKDALARNGLFSCQTGSPFYQEKTVKATRRKLNDIFAKSAIYLGCVPTYPGGLWAFGMGGKRKFSLKKPDRIPFKTRYYSRSLHQSSFSLPRYLEV